MLSEGDRPERPGWASRLRRDMTRNEQLAVYGGAVFALGVTVYFLLVPATTTHTGKTTQVSPGVTMAIGAGVFILLAGAARYGRRTVAAVISMVAAFGMGQILGFVYIALGAWLLFRSSRATRARLTAERAGGPAADRPAGRQSGRTIPARAERSRRSAGSRTRPGRQPEPPVKRTAPSKRYTPPSSKGRKR